VTRVGVLGTGRMGSAFAKALAHGGHEVLLWNRTLDRCYALAWQLGSGVQVAATAAEATANTDVTQSMVADGAAVEDVYRGPHGVLAGAHAGGVLVDLSTVPPSTIRALEPLARERGAGILDSPVSGSVGLAEAGELTLMVGGSAEDLEHARPALDSLAKRIVHMGPLGSGAAMKLAVNAVIFGLNNALAEALVLAEKAGIDRALAYDVFATSAVGATYVGYKRAAFVEPETTPVAFALELAEKDLRLIAGLADAVGTAVPQSAVNLALIHEAAADVGPDRDFSTVAVHLREAGTAVTTTRRAGEGR
jgi:3-hydroxyisobutyrate dehydrogenase/2-hydroxy-3-oxopropionate reductase